MHALTKLQENSLSLLGAFSLVALATIGILQADLTDGMSVLAWIVPISFVFGTLLALSVFTRRTSMLFSLVYGAFFCFLIIGINHTPGIEGWRDRIIYLINLQADWLGKLFGGGTSREPLIFIMHTSAVFWILGHIAAWWTARESRIWRVIIPPGIVLLSVVYYYFGPRPLWLWLTAYVIASFLYIAFTHLKARQIEWNINRVFYERTIGLNIFAAGFALALATMVVAWQVPTLEASSSVTAALDNTTPVWQRFQNTWTRLFSSLRTYSAPTSDTFSENLTLGGARNVGESLVMDIFVEEELPYAYWHAISYESYEDGLWSAPDGSATERIPDDGLFELEDYKGREVITQTVRNYLPSAGQIYGMPDIVGSDRQMFVTSSVQPGGVEQISMVQSKYVLQQGEVYNSASRMSVATQNELRVAGSNYPGWLDSYVALPDTVTDRTRDLAEELAADHDNPYDTAIAIQNYLRDNITYNDQIDAPPDGIDPVDYVLFEDPEGYCNYYSSAMVVMLRHLGIPSRPASGFAAGQFIEDAGLYRVRMADAHTWVEAYFPEYGWIQFEPTASIAVPVRPTGDEQSSPITDRPPAIGDQGPLLLEEELFPGGEGADEAFPEFEPPTTLDLTQFLTIPVIASIALILLVGAASGYTTLQNRRVQSDLGESYHQLGQWGDRLGGNISPAQTPSERAEVLTRLLPSGKEPIKNLTDQFSVSKYSREQAADPDFKPQEEWKTLRPILNKTWVNHKRKQFKQWRNRLF